MGKHVATPKTKAASSVTIHISKLSKSKTGGRQKATICDRCFGDFTSTPNPIVLQIPTCPLLPRTKGYGCCDLCCGAWRKYCRGCSLEDWKSEWGQPKWMGIRARYIEYLNSKDGEDTPQIVQETSDTHNVSATRCLGNHWPLALCKSEFGDQLPGQVSWEENEHAELIQGV